MTTTAAERTVRIPFDNRLVFVLPIDTNRTIRVRAQNRIVFVEKKPTSADRIVYANED
jgi:hypothetical protein